MAITYNVIFEAKKGKYKIAGVANNPVDTNKIAGSVASKGSEYSAMIIEYTCTTALHNDFFITYTREINEADDEKDTFHTITLLEGEGAPSTDDLYIYKLEKSATDRMNKINGSFTEEELKVKKAVTVPVTINTVY